MASTSEHISIRIPKQVLDALRKEALIVERSVSWLIVRKLSGSGELETQQSAVVDKVQRITPTLQVSNPASPTKSLEERKVYSVPKK